MVFSILSLLGVACANSNLAASIDSQLNTITGLLTSWNPGTDFGPLNSSFKNLEATLNEYNAGILKTKNIKYEEVHGITEALVDMMGEFGNREVDFDKNKQKMTALKIFAPVTPLLGTLYNKYANITTNNKTVANGIFQDLEDLSDAFTQIDDAYGIPQPELPKVTSEVKRSEEEDEIESNYEIKVVDPVVIPPRVMYYVTTYYPEGQEPASVEPPELKDVETVSMLELVTRTITGRRQKAATISLTGETDVLVAAASNSSEAVITETATATPTVPTDSVITQTAIVSPTAASSVNTSALPLSTDSAITETQIVIPSSVLTTVNTTLTQTGSLAIPTLSLPTITSTLTAVPPLASLSTGSNLTISTLSTSNGTYMSWVHPLYTINSTTVNYPNSTETVIPTTVPTTSVSLAPSASVSVKPSVTTSTISRTTTLTVVPTTKTSNSAVPTSTCLNCTASNQPTSTVHPTTQPTVAPKNAAARQYCNLLTVVLAIGAIVIV